ncbi:hypothetical protein J6590_103737 [Homalodisca vitripennis]|nr:hypothetical protein J6590_103737 [Homalodisca vitripennis]
MAIVMFCDTLLSQINDGCGDKRKKSIQSLPKLCSQSSYASSKQAMPIYEGLLGADNFAFRKP